jgi:hypothetical protein
MKLQKCFILNLALGFFVSISSQINAQTPTKDSTPIVPENRPTRPLGEPFTTPLTDTATHLTFPAPLPVSSPPGSYVSPWLMDIVKLVRARIDDAVIVTFIDSAGTFNLDAGQIIYLRDLGLSGDIIAIMIQHDGEIVSGLRPIPAAPSASSATVHLAFIPAEAKLSQPVASSRLTNSLALQNATSKNVSPALSDTGAGPAEEPEFPETEEQYALPITGPVVATRALPLTISPVRQPYAVQLLDPIVMIRAPWRPANRTLLEMLP